jgi:hypothetical protein
MTIYTDGALDESFDIGDHMNVNSEPLYIGDPLIVDKESDWIGLIDDIRIYSYALNGEEVKMLYEEKSRYERKGRRIKPLKTIPFQELKAPQFTW